MYNNLHINFLLKCDCKIPLIVYKIIRFWLAICF